MANPNRQPGLFGVLSYTPFAISPLAQAELMKYVKPPKTFDFYNLVSDYPIAGNDVVGNCLQAAFLHAMQTQMAVINQPFTPPTENQMITLNSSLGDTGQYPALLLAFWRSRGLFGTKIDGFGTVYNLKDHDAIKKAVWVYGSGIATAVLPDSVGVFFERGTEWDVVLTKQYPPGQSTKPNSKKQWLPEQGTVGHALAVTGFSKRGVKFVTWGTEAECSWEWWDEYVQQFDVVLPHRWALVGHGRLPQYSFNALKQFLKDIV